METEIDALLLENNLIKKFQPRYNVLLKDDKSYPWLCIKNERFPRLFPTRRIIKDGSEYFGPYTSTKVVNTILNLVKSIYPIRIENYNFSQKQINDLKTEIFLKTHTHNGYFLVLGFVSNPKVIKTDYISEKDYKKNMLFVREILNGKFGNIKKKVFEKSPSFFCLARDR